VLPSHQHRIVTPSWTKKDNLFNVQIRVSCYEGVNVNPIPVVTDIAIVILVILHYILVGIRAQLFKNKHIIV
jgi:hypothetical protein